LGIALAFVRFQKRVGIAKLRLHHLPPRMGLYNLLRSRMWHLTLLLGSQSPSLLGSLGLLDASRLHLTLLQIIDGRFLKDQLINIKGIRARSGRRRLFRYRFDCDLAAVVR
jgi:hypothetical protein